jgi:hypothetical protein
MATHDPGEHERPGEPYEPPAVEDLGATHGPAVSAAGATSDGTDEGAE